VAADIAILNSSLGLVSSGIPIGPLMITAVLQENGFTVSFQDYQTFQAADKPSVERFLSFMDVPESLIGISVMCTALPTVLGAVSRFKTLRPDTTVILGGPSPTDAPHEIMDSFPVDIIVRGEGEETIVELTRALKSGGALDSIKGITFRRDGRVLSTPDRPRIEDLDRLPLPAYEHVSFDDYGRQALIITSRGCPYRCSFCSSHSIWQRRMTYRGAEHVTRELKRLQGEIDRYAYYDDTFVLDPQRAVALQRQVLDSGIGLPWSCSGRVNHMTRDFLTELRDLGCQEIFYGLESGSDRVLKLISKQFTSAEAERVVLESAQILPKVHTSYMWGFPFETMDDFFATMLVLTRDMQLDNVRPQITLLTPLPASLLAQEYSASLAFSPDWQRGVSQLPGDRLQRYPELVRLIDEHPRVFTSFYHYEHPELTSKRTIVEKLAHNFSAKGG